VINSSGGLNSVLSWPRRTGPYEVKWSGQESLSTVRGVRCSIAIWVVFYLDSPPSPSPTIYCTLLKSTVANWWTVKKRKFFTCVQYIHKEMGVGGRIETLRKLGRKYHHDWMYASGRLQSTHSLVCGKNTVRMLTVAKGDPRKKSKKAWRVKDKKTCAQLYRQTQHWTLTRHFFFLSSSVKKSVCNLLLINYCRTDDATVARVRGDGVGSIGEGSVRK
jgi:hypothetical protein